MQAKPYNFVKKETPAQVFSCEFWEISKNTFFYRTLPGDCFWVVTVLMRKKVLNIKKNGQVTVRGVCAVQQQSLTDVLQNRCQACNFIKERLQHRCFPMKFTKFLRTLFLQNTSTLVAGSGSKKCKTMKTYTKSLCCR